MRIDVGTHNDIGLAEFVSVTKWLLSRLATYNIITEETNTVWIYCRGESHPVPDPTETDKLEALCLEILQTYEYENHTVPELKKQGKW